MIKTISAALAVSAVALALAAPASAQSQTAAGTTTATATVPSAGQYRASKMIGVAIYNNANEKIGSVDELMLDADGRIASVVVGVGGFLGMGEHDVAIPYGQVKWSNDATTTASNSTATTTSSGMTTTGNASTGARTASGNLYPDHGTIDASKEQLKAMPTVKY